MSEIPAQSNDNQKLVIAIIAGTIREGRESIKVANFVADIGRQLQDVEIILVDPRELNLPDDGHNEKFRDPKYSDITARADGFIIVSPEYNHGYPSSLKRVIDSEYDNYAHKPVALVGVSDGDWGGTRVVEQLTQVMRTVGLVTSQASAYFPRTPELFDENGTIKSDQVEKYTKKVQGMYKDLLWLAKTLKWGRINLLDNDNLSWL